MSKLYTLLNTLVAKVNVSVKTTTQVLTEDQKEQARTNIGAISEVDVPKKGIDYWTDADQESIVQQVIKELPVYNGEVV